MVDRDSDERDNGDDDWVMVMVVLFSMILYHSEIEGGRSYVMMMRMRMLMMMNLTVPMLMKMTLLMMMLLTMLLMMNMTMLVGQEDN